MDLEGVFFDTDDYELTNKKLGKGQFGKVYVVNCIKDGRQYAAKIIKNESIMKGKEQMMFIREVQILNKLNHPAIVKFYGINFHSFKDPDQLKPTILTEFITNGSLKEILNKEKNSIADPNWTPTKKYICLLGISDAMRYLHSQGILHRDLKPENILIDDNFYPHVCDFGISRCFPEALSNSMKIEMTGNIGTPLYMAPELFQDKGEFTAGIDVYAFAFIAYEIVTGKEPFSEKGKNANIALIFHNVATGARPEFGPGIPDKMVQLISLCWSKDPSDRPSFDHIFNLLSKDFTYINEDVDKEEINCYLDDLEDSRIKKNEVKKEDKSTNVSLLTEKQTIYQYHHFCFSNLFIEFSKLLYNKEEYRDYGFKALLPENEFHQEKECWVKPYSYDFYEHIHFLRTIECQASLKHPAILPLIGYSLPEKDFEKFGIITDYMPNGSLYNLIQEVSMGECNDNWETIKAINIFGIAAGMAYIHQHDIIHRNLKTANIVLDENYHPKICDFYFAKYFKQGTENMITQTKDVGTPLYKAPEIRKGSCHYSNKVDVYSYSMILFELLCLRAPYDSPKIFSKLLSSDTSFRPKFHDNEIPSQYVELIEKCWDEDPDERPSFIFIVKGLMDGLEYYFDLDLIDEEEFEDYIDEVTKDLDFSVLNVEPTTIESSPVIQKSIRPIPGSVKASPIKVPVPLLGHSIQSQKKSTAHFPKLTKK